MQYHNYQLPKHLRRRNPAAGHSSRRQRYGDQLVAAGDTVRAPHHGIVHTGRAVTKNAGSRVAIGDLRRRAPSQREGRAETAMRQPRPSGASGTRKSTTSANSAGGTMPYFSNGTMGDQWMERNCADCVHNRGSVNVCPLQTAFEFANYDQHREGQESLKIVLNILAPSLSEPPWNDDCKMRVTNKRMAGVPENQLELPINDGRQLPMPPERAKHNPNGRIHLALGPETSQQMDYLKDYYNESASKVFQRIVENDYLEVRPRGS